MLCSDWVKLYLGKKNGAHVLGCTCFLVVARVVYSLTLKDDADNEFTQLMKGLQGERLRQAFKFLDKDQDGYIRPEQFKKIILVRLLLSCPCHTTCADVPFAGYRWPQAF